jgi:hypothetical protein
MDYRRPISLFEYCGFALCDRTNVTYTPKLTQWIYMSVKGEMPVDLLDTLLMHLKRPARKSSKYHLAQIMVRVRLVFDIKG